MAICSRIRKDRVKQHGVRFGMSVFSDQCPTENPKISEHPLLMSMYHIRQSRQQAEPTLSPWRTLHSSCHYIASEESRWQARRHNPVIKQITKWLWHAGGHTRRHVQSKWDFWTRLKIFKTIYFYPVVHHYLSHFSTGDEDDEPKRQLATMWPPIGHGRLNFLADCCLCGSGPSNGPFLDFFGCDSPKSILAGCFGCSGCDEPKLILF